MSKGGPHRGTRESSGIHTRTEGGGTHRATTTASACFHIMTFVAKPDVGPSSGGRASHLPVTATNPNLPDPPERGRNSPKPELLLAFARGGTGP